MSPDQNDSALDTPSRRACVNPSTLGRVGAFLFRILLPILVLAGGAMLAMTLFKTGPKAKRASPVRQALIVKTETIHFSDHNILVQAMGTVQPAREINLHPRVEGEVIKMSEQLIPGGRVNKNEVILQIDPRDYTLVVRQRASDLALARSQLELELGQQSIAKREYEVLGEKIAKEDQNLVLRKPQLKSVRAALENAQAALEKAELDLERTTIRSPFNAIIKSREVDLGALVSSATPLATLVGTDAYLVVVSLPVDELKWIRIPGEKTREGSQVRIFNEAAWGEEVSRVGQVIRLTSDLEEQGRMARLLVSIANPLERQGDNPPSPLLLNSFLRIEIEGEKIKGAAPIDRTFLHEGKYLWILDAENKLDIRPVKIAFRGRDRVLITQGIREGERFITTPLSAPVQGMPLRTSGNISSAGKEKRK